MRGLIGIIFTLILLVALVAGAFIILPKIASWVSGTTEKHLIYNPRTAERIGKILSTFQKAFEPAIKAWECLNDPEKCYESPFENVRSVEYEEVIKRNYGIHLEYLKTQPVVMYCNNKTVIYNGTLHDPGCSATPLILQIPLKISVPETTEIKIKITGNTYCPIFKVYQNDIKCSEEKLTVHSFWSGVITCTIPFNKDFWKSCKSHCYWDTEECPENEKCDCDLKYAELKLYYEEPEIKVRVYYNASTKADYWLIITKEPILPEDFFKYYQLPMSKYAVSRYTGLNGLVPAISTLTDLPVFPQGYPFYVFIVLRKNDKIDKIGNLVITFENVKCEAIEDISLPKDLGVKYAKIKVSDGCQIKISGDFTKIVNILNDKEEFVFGIKLNPKVENADYKEIHIITIVDYVAYKEQKVTGKVNVIFTKT